MKSSNSNSFSGAIRLSNRFFTQERNNYSDWKFALWRELAQNSYDAHCSQFDIKLEKISDNETRVVFADDGIGMTEEILLDAFLVVGESGKKDEDSVGGFGKAKILLAFSQIKYTIKSNNFVCEGNGANFTITKYKDLIKGCIFEIIVDSDVESLRHSLNEFVGLSYLPLTKIYLNKEQINKSLHRGRHVRDLSFGEVFVNKSGKKNLVIVRVNGVAMFSSYTAANAQVILNIKAALSKEVLLSNRDSLKYSFQQEFNLFLQELAIDCVSALDDKSKRFTKYVNQNKFLTKRRKQEITESPAAQSGEVQFWEQKETNNNSHAVKPIIPQNIGDFENAQHNEQNLCPILASMVIVNECEDQKIINLIRLYDPTKGKIGSNRYSFIKQWHAVIDIALEKFLEMSKLESINFAIGLVFDNHAENTTLAQHIYSNGVHYFLINPILANGVMRYSLNNRGDYYRLLSRGTHEISHIAFPQHDQSFSYFRDALFEECLQNVSETFQAIKSAK